MLRDVEGHPWRAIGYMIYIVQIMYMVLDLAVGRDVDISWHNAATTIEFLSAVFLASYQAIRISAVLQRATTTKSQQGERSNQESGVPEQATRRHIKSRQYLWLIGVALMLQISISILAACSFSRDLEAIEWIVFLIAVAWSIVNAWSYCVAQSIDYSRQVPTSSLSTSPDPAEGASRRAEAPPLAAVVTSAGWIWERLPWHEIQRRPRLAGTAVALLALSHAALVSLQGVLIDWLLETSSVLALSLDSVYTFGKDPQYGASSTVALPPCVCQVSRYAYGLVAAWFAATACHVLLRVVRSSALLRLELWLRDRFFAVVSVAGMLDGGGIEVRPADRGASIAELQKVYQGDIECVNRLCSAMLEILAKGLLAISTFFALVALNGKVAVMSLSLISLVAVVSGAPTALSIETAGVGDEGDEASALVRDGATLLLQNAAATEDPRTLRMRHRVHVTIPLRASWLRRTVYSEPASDLFVGVFGSFLTVAVVVAMAFDVAERATSPERSVAVLYLFVRLLRAANRLPTLARLVASNFPSAGRVESALRLGLEGNSRTTTFPSTKVLATTIPTSTETELGVEVPTNAPESESFSRT
jgi:hypothetical protein